MTSSYVHIFYISMLPFWLGSWPSDVLSTRKLECGFIMFLTVGTDDAIYLRHQFDAQTVTQTAAILFPLF